MHPVLCFIPRMCKRTAYNALCAGTNSICPVNSTMKDYSSHFRDLIESQLPDDSRILMPGGQDMIVLVTWRLKSDDFRPSKRSRMVRIVISEEAMEDYVRGSDGARLVSNARFISWLNRQLEKFDPDHDAP